jgi:hypothetical protein
MKDIYDLIKQLKNNFHINVTLCNKDIKFNSKIPISIKKSLFIDCVNIEDVKIMVVFMDYKTTFSKKHIQLLSEASQLPILIVKDTIHKSMTEYFIENKISFVSQNSLYLAPLLIYFKNINKQPKNISNKKLSKSANMILLSYLLNLNEKDLTIKYYQDKFNITAMSASRALIELNENNILDVQTINRAKHYNLKQNIKLDNIIDKLQNPIVSTIFIKSSDLKYFEQKYKTSFDALSQYTNITNQKQIYAIDKTYFNQIQNQHNITLYDMAYDNDIIQIELYKYIPYTTNTNIIDPFTLYISIKDTINYEDTRLQDAINELNKKLEQIVLNKKTNR